LSADPTEIREQLVDTGPRLSGGRRRGRRPAGFLRPGQAGPAYGL